MAGLLALALAAPAAAHQLSTSTGEWRSEGPLVRARLVFAAADLLVLGPTGEAQRAAIGAGLRVRAGGQECAPEEEGPPRAAAGATRALAFSFRCPTAPDPLQLTLGFLDALPPGHAHLVSLRLEDGPPEERVLRAGAPSLELGRSGAAGAFTRFLALGVEHIFTGWDHLAFLLGLLLLGGSLRQVIQIVTSFTAAHSITLALAALDLVAPPARVIEPLIALSIVLVAAENLHALRRGGSTSALDRRWRLTFAFGLVHGFGFASALRELQLPRASLAAGLVSFNLGVEAGQLCVVGALLPLLAWLRRRPGFVPLGVSGASLGVAGLGAFWLVQRLFE